MSVRALIPASVSCLALLGCAAQPNSPSVDSLRGCWVTRGASTTIWSTGKIDITPAECSRFFSVRHIFVHCRQPGVPEAKFSYVYRSDSPGTYTMSIEAAESANPVGTYAKPHEFSISSGELTIVSYPIMSRNVAQPYSGRTVTHLRRRANVDRPEQCSP